MAHNRDYKPEDIAFPDQVITESELVGEMERSYIEYAMSVIVGRALPDVRDGLKPVHRRILYAMYEDGLTSDKPFKKSATCVGDVLGRYHPHGDASVYDAMVRLAQDFSMRYMLVEGHGNFGSVDGDPPAAYRYTEARMSKICNEMLRDIEKNTVDWIPNFDESRKEPLVLPSRFPNLLVNGSSGIAVGMATNIPPHNLGEVIDACVCILDNPDATLEDLMQHVKGPDFPTKGIIMGRAGIRQAYATGRGKIIVRARTEFEEYGKDHRTRIIVTELPYQVNKRQLVKNIADQVKEKRLEGISDLREESDRNGMRVVIELKRDANPQVVLNHLFAQTALQSSFSIIMLALVDNQRQPKILSLRHILDEYIRFQEDLIIRRTKYDLGKAKERAHLLEGLIIAQDNIDEVIHIIRTSYDDAKERLMQRFGLDEVQTQAILDMRLKALQGLDREKLEGEYKELQDKIAYYEKLLASEDMLRQVLKDELIQIRDKYGDKRRTEICVNFDEIDAADLIERENVVISMTHFGYIKRLPVSEYKAQHRGGAGITAHKPKEEDFVENMFVTCTHDDLMFFTNKGKVYRIKAYFVPEAERTARGRAIVNLLQLLPDERVTAVIPIKEGSDMDGCLIMATRHGLIKKTPLSEFESIRKVGKIAIVLREGDELISVSRVSEGDDVMLASAFGKCIRFNESDVRSMGRTSSGVRSIKTDGEDDYVVDMAVIEKDSVKDVLTVTELGYGKRCPITEYRVQSRAGKGSKAGKFSDETGRIVNLKLVDPGDDVMLIANTGIIIRMPASEISRISRSTKGVRIMRLKEDGRVVCVAVAAHEEEVEAEAEKTPDLAENPAPETVAISEQIGEENETPEESETVNSDSPDEVE
ncbi:MAG: DNA gyrase subunit A [Firmicutes bacterium]|nr:DNA gyrase subunit A [Bacillota bacterium]MDY5531227.1 DNA gyrase subunit A [Pumilibacteraceae bacterium]